MDARLAIKSVAVLVSLRCRGGLDIKTSSSIQEFIRMEIKECCQPSAKGPSEWFHWGLFESIAFFRHPIPPLFKRLGVTCEPGARNCMAHSPPRPDSDRTACCGWAQRKVDRSRNSRVTCVFLAPARNNWHAPLRLCHDTLAHFS